MKEAHKLSEGVLRKLMKRLLCFSLVIWTLVPIQPVHAGDTNMLMITEEKMEGYNRSLFKHWVDADKNGCNTRQEVLIEEAIVRPKIGNKCVLSGGTWLSSYDNKTIKGSGSTLDVDHMVPLAEAWRSGAWQWTNEERQLFANDLKDSRALIAVTASSNRSKGDRDLANWLPKRPKEVVCDYVFAWVAVKMRYSLSVDPKEMAAINEIVLEPACNARNASQTFTPLVEFEKYHANYASPTVSPTPATTPTPTVSPTPATTPTPTVSPTPATTPTPTATRTATPTPTVSATSTPTPAVSSTPVTESEAPSPSTTTAVVKDVTAGAFCSPAGASGLTKTGLSVTCKTSATDTRNRWRQ